MRAPDERSGPASNGTAPGNTTEDQGSTLLDHALDYAARGWPVFPLRPRDKRPATRHGFKDATTDPEQIRTWWTATPDANIGIPTGQVSGLVVLDPDDGPAGVEALDQLQAELGTLPATLTVCTPGDSAKGKRPGLHLYLYLAHPGGKVKNSAGQLGEDLDVRADGGYVAAAGSVLADGPYTIEHDGPVAKLPDAWAKRLINGTKPAQEETRKPADDGADLFDKPGRTFTKDQALAYAREHADARVLAAQPGNRNHTLNQAALVYGHFVPALLDEDVARKRLAKMAEHMGLDEDEAGPTIASGLAAGIAEPYTVTDADQAQEDAANKRVQAILDAALDAEDLDQLPEPEPLLPGYLNRSEYVLLSGKFGTYKSFVVLAWAYALATGQGWGGQEPAEARPVVYVAAEGVAGLRRRLRALERHHGTKVPRGMLTVIRRPVRLANPEEVQGLRLIMERTGAQLVILDTWHRMTPGIEENSATETGGPLDVALSLRDDYGATVLLIHHTGHAQRHARGSSALEDDADASWMIALGKGQEEDEDRGPGTPRVLVHRKAKDGELAQPARLQLLVDDEREAVVTVSPVDLAPMPRTGRPVRVTHADAVQELIHDLDQAGAPADWGYRRIREWDADRRPGHAATEKACGEAADARKGREAARALELTAGPDPAGQLDKPEARS